MDKEIENTINDLFYIIGQQSLTILRLNKTIDNHKEVMQQMQSVIEELKKK